MKMLLTRKQLLTVLYGWGYVAGNVPTQSEPMRLVSIPPAARTGAHTRAKLTRETVNGAGHRLFAMELMD